MHPEDDRYKEYAHGQKIELEWINGPITATVIKDEAVDMEFGTGVMTITPWHDAIDFDIAQRHDLETEQIIDFNGKLLPVAKEFAGMPILEARKKIVEKLQQKGLLVKTEEDYKHSIKVCYKCGTPIEPQIKEQWFVRMKQLAEMAMQPVRDGEIAFMPKRFEKIFFHWMNNTIDWNISRQIVWGIPIPAKICNDCHEGFPDLDNTIDKCTSCFSSNIRKETDTFDTWFSSGQWPLLALGYPDSQDFHTYYPTDVMETGADLVFKWVPRMIIFGMYLAGKKPFGKVYFHGMVNDEHNQKMSKSKGNVISPVELSQQFGTDAMRMSLVIGNGPGNNIPLSYQKVESYRNFTNKLWNIGRYVMTQSKADQSSSSQKSAADEWILQRLSATIESVTRHLDQYNFSLAGEALRDFTWNEFADWYVEIHKIEKNDSVLRYTFETLLKLWHPFMPFVTEALFQEMRPESEKLLMVEKWPDMLQLDEQPRNFGRIISAITSIRNLRSTYRIDPGKKITALIVSDETEYLSSQRAIIEKLARVEDLHISSDNHGQSEDMACTVTADMSICIRLGNSIDIEQEEKRLNKEIDETNAYILRLKAKLSNETFLAKAPEAIANQTKRELSQAEEKATEIEKRLKQLKG